MTTTPSTVVRTGTADRESFEARTDDFDARTLTASGRRASTVVLASGRRVVVEHGRDFGGLIRASQTR